MTDETRNDDDLKPARSRIRASASERASGVAERGSHRC
jgi:hypothetical protein